MPSVLPDSLYWYLIRFMRIETFRPGEGGETDKGRWILLYRVPDGFFSDEWKHVFRIGVLLMSP